MAADCPVFVFAKLSLSVLDAWSGQSETVTAVQRQSNFSRPSSFYRWLEEPELKKSTHLLDMGASETVTVAQNKSILLFLRVLIGF